MKIKLNIIFLTLLLFCVSYGKAAKVVLKEGKVLHGKIVSEDDEEIFMILGANMTIRVEKDKIREIIRPKKSKKKANVVTMDDVRAKEKEEEEAKADKEGKKEDKKDAKKSEKKEAKKEKEKEPKKELVLENTKPGSLFRESKKKGISIHETKVLKVYELKSKTFEKAQGEIFSRSKGKGFKSRFGRKASQTKMTASWTGKSGKEGRSFRWSNLILIATITTTNPAWTPSREPEKEEIESWNAFMGEIKSHDMGRTGLYLQALARLGDSLAALRKPNEKDLRAASEKLFNKALAQVEKRQEGFDRRQKRRKRRTPKPPEK